MDRRYYSKRHFERLSNGGPDKPGDGERRQREQALREQANREMLARFAPLTHANVKAALDWQAARIVELLASLPSPV